MLNKIEVAKTTIAILDKYKEEDTIEDALKPDYNHVPPEDFLEQYFESHSYPEEVQDQVAEFFFRIQKYRKFFTIICTNFFSAKTTLTSENRKELSLYLVFLYLLIIELNEVTRSKIEDLLISLNEKKALSLLLILKRTSSITKLFEWGCQIWDVEYVKTVLENVLNEPLFKDVYETLAGNVEKTKKSKKKQLTIPQGPKCLSRPKKFVPSYKPKPYCPTSETRIPLLIDFNKLFPKETYVKPIPYEGGEKFYSNPRERAEKLFEEAQKKAFRCAKVEKSDKFKQLTEAVAIERSGIPLKKRFYNKINFREVKSPKKTAAVILREGARLLKLEQKEIKRYEDIENGGFDNELLLEWAEENKEENFRNHLKEIEKKHLEGLLSYEEALLAKQKCLKRKKEMADEFRKEREEWLKQLEEWKNEEQIRIQESFEKGKALEKGAKEAMEQVKEEKHKIALETIEESKALKKKWLEEKEQDLQRKVQLIKQIKALQTLSVVRRKQIDRTETGNLGFLYEMSIAELKERLFILKIEVQEELEKRRAEIKIKRECRKEIINEYQELIDSHRKLVEEQKKSIQSEKKYENEKENSCKSESLETLRRKLCEKRKERLKYQI